ncbi:hypothetical protein GLAREA_06203 [Glarea lozoyensis ATCC 20868]|uniref:NADH-ubiquinone oxidoreductase 14 kDa subunit n=1 Tax=Glarea lozoyensis (strain ATCC 20868 / MF5171) TaxID=1116229 RepID=S3DM86_GLAL2|nr:uncharacterized protein GLAREA_06203 [Glarea lozoyensis ATCC 20868]EPE33191.1 hypothetical protein GLAREA_06203 [Glarea lozoyensis ATCC 20868]
MLLWGGFGLGVRFLQLSIEKRPYFNRGSLWAWPLFAGVGGTFGYWLMGIEERQLAILGARRASILEKRARRKEVVEEES